MKMSCAFSLHTQNRQHVCTRLNVPTSSSALVSPIKNQCTQVDCFTTTNLGKLKSSCPLNVGAFYYRLMSEHSTIA